MSRDERLATVISDALRASLDDAERDPAAIERVGQAVGVALGGPAAEPDKPDRDTGTGGWADDREPRVDRDPT